MGSGSPQVSGTPDWLLQVVAVGALPSLADSAPGFVNDAFAVATGGHATGDIGLLQGAGWVINLAVAEYVIRRHRSRRTNRAMAAVGS